ncbi:AI-2E family transporter [Thalassorhabdomicrobium marinisediminis]|uniref:AI-2E family transporter n=1 Tax=Thalassorhabdomicrobium marinisediminis TaxID=2170577 RepID=A0A2T7FUX9_9RHOB|nr:AI-2E family transporter [Thalassorhabdomicrobium marinisediminis]PVA05976.1 AI-2E family transporter [Thalassorhabdomicrobium marinisediminis]
MRNATYGTALTLMIGWILWIGKPVLLPILAAVISVYVLLTAATSMQKVPVLGSLPDWARRALILALFTFVVILLFLLVINNLAQVAAALPRYQSNLELLITRNASILGIEDEPTWENVRRETLDQVNFRSWVAPALLSLRGFGATLFLVVLYASFLIAERGAMARKVVMAMGDEEAGARAISLVSRINERIGQYLFVKTVVNVILGGISFAIMLLLGIEFALFWAVLIAFLNYIPYIGSLVGVLFPVLLSLAQFGSLGMATVVLVSLTTAQVFVAAYLEPRMMGRAFNLSPFVVLLALAFWSTLWGLAGALLAVPLTASLVLLLAEIQTMRPIAVLLSANGNV